MSNQGVDFTKHKKVEDAFLGSVVGNLEIVHIDTPDEASRRRVAVRCEECSAITRHLVQHFRSGSARCTCNRYIPPT